MELPTLEVVQKPPTVLVEKLSQRDCDGDSQSRTLSWLDARLVALGR